MLARQGLTDAQIADELEVSERTFNRWKQDYPELRHALKEGKELPNSAVESSLFQRAMGFAYREGSRERVALPDVAACIFWLKNRRPDRWRKVKGVEVTQVVRSDLIAEISDSIYEVMRETLTPEDLDRLIAAIERKFGVDGNGGEGCGERRWNWTRST